MAIPDPSLLVMDISYSIFRSLKMRLQEDNAWRVVAENFKIFRPVDIWEFAHCTSQSPSEKLIFELHERGCTVRHLCIVLRQCQLFEALSLLTQPERLEITVHPGDGTDGDILVTLDGELNLKCEATGLPPPKYQWYHENEELFEQTSNTLVIQNFSFDEEGLYYCCVTQDGDPPTEVFTSSVNAKIRPEPPIIWKEPRAQEVCRVGSDVIFTCEASAHPPPHYQWFRDNTPLSGQNNYRLTIQGVTQSDQGEYKCSVENEAGEVFSRLSELVIYEEPEDGDNDTYRYTASEKVALLIGNDVYENMGRLNTPSNDVISVATILHQIGFKVIALHNLTLTEMRNAIKEFCNLLSRGVYGVFYFVGHGFEISGDKFMLPVDAPDPTRYLRRDSLCERELIYKAQKKNPQLLLVLLDMCLKTPDQESNPIIHKEKALMYPWVPRRNLLIGYATTNNLSAYEVDTEENGVYATHLQRHLADDLPVEEVMKRVRSSIESENSSASKQQIPCAFVTVARRFRLTDPIRGDPDVAKAYERITTVSVDTTHIAFENIRKFANMTCMPHRGWLHNSLDINLTGLESFNVKFLVMCQNLKLCAERHNGDLLLTVFNLQKTKMPVVITIELCDPRDQVNSILMDNSMLDLHYPLISSADLWRPIILDTDHSELWDDSVEDVSPDYDNFMIDLES
ncbi:unnamed protein product [Timema podura]|uniref:Mucosa-associated lymphoid tissue lymphoma translocation protein 1 n=1 Tax=Timema podura TaxID=61482 RepID=A0ABN7NIS8_TIMPD|nr:unnamed protein product [Timema podura]